MNDDLISQAAHAVQSLEPQSPQIPVSSSPFALGVVGLLLFGHIFLNYLIRQWSSNRLAARQDRAEGNLIDALQAQATAAQQRADKAESERNLAMVEIGELRGQIAAFASQMASIQHDLSEARTELGLARQEVAALRAAVATGGTP